MRVVILATVHTRCVQPVPFMGSGGGKTRDYCAANGSQPA